MLPRLAWVSEGRVLSMSYSANATAASAARPGIR